MGVVNKLRSKLFSTKQILRRPTTRAVVRSKSVTGRSNKRLQRSPIYSGNALKHFGRPPGIFCLPLKLTQQTTPIHLGRCFST
jgi:hypothetical protein